MSIETEVKVPIGDAAAFVGRMAPLHPLPISVRHLEDNYVLDFPDGRLRARQELVRVRITQAGGLLTFKGPPRMGGVFKVREELETKAEDGCVVLRILNELGLRVWFRYQKYRREYVLAPSAPPGGEVRVAVDETPIGNYAELEGCEDAIRALAAALGFGESHFLRDSYYALYVRYCRERGEPEMGMTFPLEAAYGSGGGGEDSR